MKREIELKFFIGDLSAVRKKLKKLGARLLWAGKEYNWFFDTPRNTMKRRGITVRMKQTSRESTLTLKKKVFSKKFKKRNEFEITVSNPDEMSNILRLFGFYVWLQYEKRREHYALSGAHVELDTLRDGRTFVEIEGSEKTIRILAKKLNCSFAKSTPKSYIQLLRKK